MMNHAKPLALAGGFLYEPPRMRGAHRSWSPSRERGDLPPPPATGATIPAHTVTPNPSASLSQ